MEKTRLTETITQALGMSVMRLNRMQTVIGLIV